MPRAGFRSKFTGMMMLMVFLLAMGCSSLPASNGVVPPVETRPKTQVLSPVYVNYLVVNPLPIVVEDTRAEGILNDNVVDFISGLRDEEVEKKINDNLRALYDDMRERDVAPYRGIRLLVTEGSTLARNYLRSNVTYNYNNVLSVQVLNGKAYVTKDGPYGSSVTNVSTIETRNFDLTTGEEIRLKDVFADDVDYLEVLNNRISQRLLSAMPTDESNGHIGTLISSFTGISEDQVFLLTPQGINIVLDYRTPEFDTGFGYNGISLTFQELQGVVAVNQRYYSKDANIFLSESPALMELLAPPYHTPQVGESRDELTENVYALASYRYPESLPTSMREIVMQKFEAYREKVNELLLMTESQWLVTHNVRATQAGRFTNVTVDQSVYQSDEPFVDYEDPFRWMYGREGFVGSKSASYCFDGDGQERSLASLFVAGFDYQGVIKKALAEATSRQGIWYKESPSVEELWDDLQFSLDTTYLRFYTRPVDNEPIIFSVSFSQLGCHNMTVFR